MNALILCCCLCAAPVPKSWKPPLTFDVTWVGGFKCWEVRRGEKELWYFVIEAYSQDAVKGYIEAEDQWSRDPLNPRLDRSKR